MAAEEIQHDTEIEMTNDSPSDEQPAGIPVEQPAGNPAEHPADQPVEHPAEHPAEQPSVQCHLNSFKKKCKRGINAKHGIILTEKNDKTRRRREYQKKYREMKNQEKAEALTAHRQSLQCGRGSPTLEMIAEEIQEKVKIEVASDWNNYEQTIDLPVEQPTELPVEQLMTTQPAELQTGLLPDHSAEYPAEQLVTIQPVEQRTEQPVEQRIEYRAQQLMTIQPAEQQTGLLWEHPAENPTEQIIEQLFEFTAEQPTEHSMDQPNVPNFNSRRKKSRRGQHVEVKHDIKVSVKKGKITRVKEYYRQYRELKKLQQAEALAQHRLSLQRGNSFATLEMTAEEIQENVKIEVTSDWIKDEEPIVYPAEQLNEQQSEHPAEQITAKQPAEQTTELATEDTAEQLMTTQQAEQQTGPLPECPAEDPTEQSTQQLFELPAEQSCEELVDRPIAQPRLDKRKTASKTAKHPNKRRKYDIEVTRKSSMAGKRREYQRKYYEMKKRENAEALAQHRQSLQRGNSFATLEMTAEEIQEKVKIEVTSDWINDEGPIAYPAEQLNEQQSEQPAEQLTAKQPAEQTTELATEDTAEQLMTTQQAEQQTGPLPECPAEDPTEQSTQQLFELTAEQSSEESVDRPYVKRRLGKRNRASKRGKQPNKHRKYDIKVTRTHSMAGKRREYNRKLKEIKKREKAEALAQHRQSLQRGNSFATLEMTAEEIQEKVKIEVTSDWINDEEPIVYPAEQFNEQQTEHPTEKLSTKQPAEHPAEQPAEDTAEQLMTTQPAEQQIGLLPEHPAEDPTEQSTEQLFELTAEQSSEESVDRPIVQRRLDKRKRASKTGKHPNRLRKYDIQVKANKPMARRRREYSRKYYEMKKREKAETLAQHQQSLQRGISFPMLEMTAEEIQEKVKIEMTSDWIKDEEPIVYPAEQQTEHPAEQSIEHPAEQLIEHPAEQQTGRQTGKLLTEQCSSSSVASETSNSLIALQDHQYAISLSPQQDSRRENVIGQEIQQIPVQNSDHEEPEIRGHQYVINIRPQPEWSGENIDDEEIRPESALNYGHEEPETYGHPIAQTTNELFQGMMLSESQNGMNMGTVRHVASQEGPQLIEGTLVEKEPSNRKKKGDYVKCPICQGVYSSKNGILKGHITRFHGKRQSRILERQRESSYRQSEGEKCVCSVCGMQFKRKASLANHMRLLHSGEKPCKCSVCGEKFPHKHHLQKHMRSHPRVQRNGVIGAANSQKGAHETHMNVQSTGHNSETCTICQELFSDKAPKSVERPTAIHSGGKSIEYSGERVSAPSAQSLGPGLDSLSDQITITYVQLPIASLLSPPPVLINLPSAEIQTVQPQSSNHIQIQTVQPQSSNHIQIQTVQPQSSNHIQIQTVEPQSSNHIRIQTVEPQSSNHIQIQTVQPQSSNHIQIQTVEPQSSNHIQIQTVQPQSSNHIQIQTTQPQSSNHIQIQTVQPQSSTNPQEFSLGDQNLRTSDGPVNHIMMNNGEDTPHQCSACGRQFSQKLHLDIHMKTDHGETLHKCFICGASFYQNEQLEMHMRTHAGEKPYDCSTCGKKFSKKWQVNTHKRIEHGEKPNQCSVCGESFAQADLLEIHIMRTHTEEQQLFECAVCGMKFIEKWHLQIHKHNGDKPHKCSLCGKRFRLEMLLETHLKTQHGDKRHLCSTCGKSFAEQQQLEKHMKSHNKSYECSTCGKKFSHKDTLKKHLKIHNNAVNGDESSADVAQENVSPLTTEKFKCIICNELFDREKQLSVHMKATHYDKTPYKCPSCDQTFNEMARLVNHTRLHSGEKPYVCPVCAQKFRTKCYATMHMRVHSDVKPYQCYICGMTFRFNSGLSSHLKTHRGERLYLCTICGKKFVHQGVLTKHLRTHNEHEEDKKFVCEVCGGRFRIKSALDSHMISHSEERPYGCSLCDRHFKSKRDRDRHTVMYCAEPYKCSLCDRTFRAKSECQNHQMQRHGVKLADCVVEENTLCHKNSTMRREPPEKHQCSSCDMKFRRKIDRDRHAQSHAEKEYRCDICDYTFTREWNYKVHMQKHSDKKPEQMDKRRYGCFVCGRKFLLKGTLAGHLTTHSEERPWKCSVCGNRYKSKYHRNAHEKMHTMERVYECDLCGKKFKEKGGRRRHMRETHGQKE